MKQRFLSPAYRVSGWNRRRKWQLFLQYFSPTPRTTVLDVGASDAEYSPTDNFLEKNYPYPRAITALVKGETDRLGRRYPEITAVSYAGGAWPFADKAFDICWSNAVLEHVGGRAEQTAFLREAARTARQAFITTPNRFFPIEVHTRLPLLHIILPRPWFDGMLRLLGRGWAAGDYMHLLSRRDLIRCLEAAGIRRYRIIKNKFFIWTLDFVVIIYE